SRPLQNAQHSTSLLTTTLCLYHSLAPAWTSHPHDKNDGEWRPNTTSSINNNHAHGWVAINAEPLVIQNGSSSKGSKGELLGNGMTCLTPPPPPTRISPQYFFAFPTFCHGFFALSCLCFLFFFCLFFSYLFDFLRGFVCWQVQRSFLVLA